VQILNANIELVCICRSCITIQSVLEFSRDFVVCWLQQNAHILVCFNRKDNSMHPNDLALLKIPAFFLDEEKDRKSNQFQLVSVCLRLPQSTADSFLYPFSFLSPRLMVPCHLNGTGKYNSLERSIRKWAVLWTVIWMPFPFIGWVDLMSKSLTLTTVLFLTLNSKFSSFVTAICHILRAFLGQPFYCINSWLHSSWPNNRF
jgi:hypothetical protein